MTNEDKPSWHLKGCSRHFIYLIALLGTLLSCVPNRQAERVLDTADSLMANHSDSALTLLADSTLPTQLHGEGQRMRYALLYTEALDKNFQPLGSDSLMHKVVTYYQENGTPLDQVRSNYLLGRVCQEMGLLGSAITAYQKAMEIPAEQDPTTYAYQYRACARLGDINEQKGALDKSLHLYVESRRLAIQSSDTISEVYALRDIARIFSKKGLYDKAIATYKQSCHRALECDDSLSYDMVSVELAATYMDNQQMEEAAEIIRRLPIPQNSQDKPMYYWCKGNYYEKTGKIDSAIVCRMLTLEDCSLTDKTNTLWGIARLYEKMGS